MLFLHISDIHFKHVEVGQPDDPNRALRNDLIADLKKMRVKIGLPVDGILLSGDIAFAGKAEEYDIAYAWLENEVCPAVGSLIENVFVIPGNHDVDRTADAGPAQVMVRTSLREVAATRLNAMIREWMRDRVSANVIFGPIENYNRFAAKFLCPLRPYLDDVKTPEQGGEQLPSRPFARRDVKLNDRSTLRLWGFNSVIVSDEDDAEGLMLVDPAASQIETQDGVAHLVMCHHPFGWIKNRQAFEDRLNAVAKIQLFGHEHTRRVDEARRYIRIRAGALQPNRDDPEWKPGYNLIDASVAKDDGKRYLVVKVWVRMHEVAQFIAIPDPDDNEVWENSFVLPDWAGAAAAPTTEDEEGTPVPALDSPMTQTPTPVTVRSVTIKFFKLKEHEQRRVIAQMKLDRPGDRDLKDYEFVISAVRRSGEEGSLQELDALLDQTLTGTRRS